MRKGQPFRVLIIDDDPTIHEMFRELLTAEFPVGPSNGHATNGHINGDHRRHDPPRFEIDSAYGGEEGLEMVRKAVASGRGYTIAFVDLRMRRGWDGIETIGHIWKECFDLQTVICTAFEDYTWHQIIEKFGHSDRLLILKKPFDVTEVRQLAYALAEKWTLSHEAQTALERLQRLVAERTGKLEEANRSLQRKITENKRAEHRLLTQFAVSQALAEACTSEDATERVIVIICASMNWDWGGLWNIDQHAGVLRLGKCWHVISGSYASFESLSRASALARGVDLPGQVWQSRQAVWQSDIFRDTPSPRQSAAVEEGLHGAIAFPIRVEGKVFGVMEFLSRDIRERDVEMMQTFSVIGSSLGQFIERKQAEDERRSMEIQLRHAQKLESIGQLAAGIAHEINTPTQYLGDNLRFLETSFSVMSDLHGQYQRLFRAFKDTGDREQLVAETEAAARRAEVDFLAEEVPRAIEQALAGVQSVARIVRAMKDFSHPGSHVKVPVNLNRAIETTVEVAANEWKYVANVVKDFDANLPLVPCLPGEFNQVVLNLVVNAGHAIAEVVGDGSARKGTITLITRACGDAVEVRVRDTGAGIPENIRGKIFDPFFTTKPVGKGTGQGLAISRAVIVDQHNGSLTFESEVGLGTEFTIRLPLAAAKPSKTENQDETNLICR